MTEPARGLGLESGQKTGAVVAAAPSDDGAPEPGGHAPAAASEASAARAPSSHLYAALAALQAELPIIAKGQTADAGQYSYTYADLAEISAVVLKLLGEHGLAFLSKPTLVDGRFVLAYSLLHEEGGREDGFYPLPTNATPQQLGSAITYGRRYCLCAVTGVATADDDDDARKAAEKQERAADTAALVDRANAADEMHYQNEMQDAVTAVQGAWVQTFGRYDVNQVAPFFARWSGGKPLREAPPWHLRKFAAYLSAIPAAEAGTDPANHRFDHETPAEEPPPATERPRRAKPPSKLTGPMRGRIFAELAGRGIRDDDEQRDWLTEKLAELSGDKSRVIKSRGELTYDDGHALIAWFEANPQEATSE